MKRAFKVMHSITSAEGKSFDKYLNEVSKYKPLTVDEEVKLGKLILEGDQLAVDTLVKANLRFVISVAKQSVNKNDKLEDLVMEGNIGLHKAAQRFDYTKGFKFISYAVWYIRKEINDYRNNCSRTIRIPTNKVNHLIRLKSIMCDLEQKLEREPSAEEIYDVDMGSNKPTNLTLSQISNLLELDSNPVGSLDKKLDDSDSSSSTIIDNVSATPYYDADYKVSINDDKDLINYRLEALSNRDRMILEMAFGLNGYSEMNAKEIGERMSLTSEAIRQIKLKAIRTISRKIKNDKGEFNNL